jgi:hypothetical protein
MLLMLCVCSHQVLNLFTPCSLCIFFQKLVPSISHCIPPKQMFPRATKNNLKQKYSIHCFCPNLRRVNRSYFSLSQRPPNIIIIIIIITSSSSSSSSSLVVLYLAMIGK